MKCVMKMDELKNRKTTRLKGADYTQNQAVFLTICTKERRCVLSRIVGTGVLDGPYSTEFHSVTVRVYIQKILQQRIWNNGINIWQYRSNDHIIRNRQHYEEHLQYIYENPIRWYYDELYTEE